MPVEARRSAGFSLVELAIVLVCATLVLAMGIGSYQHFAQDSQTRGTAQAVAQQVQLARARAMSTGRTQTVNFDTGTTPQRVVMIDGTYAHTWSLPRGVTFTNGSATTLSMTRDGRSATSSYVVVRNTRGLVDTVSVESSGLVLVL